MSEAVQPVTPEPCVTQDSVRFSHLVVDLVQAKDTLYHVLYIGTGEPAGLAWAADGEVVEAGWGRGCKQPWLKGCFLLSPSSQPPQSRVPS